MKKLLTRIMLGLLVAVMITPSALAAGRYDYSTVPGDPMKSLLYTLPNGLKVYMTVNKEQPRIQTYIAVRVGGKNDPAETTGLAHYFEHLMFKGTKQFGTTDYAAEEPMLNEIERLFEVYRNTRDDNERAAIYHRIDSISYEASKLAIPNEYDKLMAAIGAEGTNAYTSYDVTCYTEDIPSNQIESWARIQSDRFKNPILRGFHTELETIYEEKNMSLTNDNEKMSTKMWELLTPNHPYGSQTILGTQEHLKNPSITNVKNYHSQWYVPNNMAICLSGDFDPDNMIDIITRYFGDMQPNPSLPVTRFKAEQPITSPIKADVYGNEADQILLAWRFPGQGSREAEILDVVGDVLYNGDAGMLDINVNQKQKTLGTYAGVYGQADYAAFLMVGVPKEGQTLDDVKALLLQEVANLRAGNFDDDLLPAIINNNKLAFQQRLEDNSNRADMYVNSFVFGKDWADYITTIDRQSKLTKQDIVDFANRYLTDSNYAAVYKHQGKDTTEVKIAKPAITPIVMNRDATSAFLNDIRSTSVTPIEPVFLDFDKDLTFLKADKDIEVLYKKNTNNDIFSLIFVYDLGSNHDRRLGLAASYLNYIGTPDMTPEQISNEFYKLACSFGTSVSGNRSYIMLSGLSENMPRALELLEKLLAEAVADPEAYTMLAQRNIKSRNDAKANQSQNFARLRNYMTYGDAPLRNMLTNDELQSMDPSLLTESLRNMRNFKHRIIYYGNFEPQQLLDAVNRHHRTPAVLADAPARINYPVVRPEETVIYVAPYDAKNLYMSQLSNDGQLYTPSMEPMRQIYDEYFGGGMNAIVFQEMRESRGLAYSAWAGLNPPGYADQPYTYMSYIATQNDKLMDAINAFNSIINDMPQSENAFALAKQSIDARLRTNRTIKDNVAWAYLNNLDLNETIDPNRRLFEALPGFTLDKVVAFQRDKVKDRIYHYAILANPDEIDLEALERIGKVKILTTEQIFGY